MYNQNMQNNDNEKQAILNNIRMMNFFGNEPEEPKINRFQINLYKQLNHNFPVLMKNVSFEDMDFIIKQFNLSQANHITKQNIKKLIEFLKIHDKIKQQEKEEFERNIEIKVQQQNYEKISDAIDLFNKITETKQSNEPIIKNKKDNDISKYINISQSKKDEKVDFETLLQQRQLEHQQLLQSQQPKVQPQQPKVQPQHQQPQQPQQKPNPQSHIQQLNVLNDEIEKQRKQFELELQENNKNDDEKEINFLEKDIDTDRQLRLTELEKFKHEIPEQNTDNIKIKIEKKKSSSEYNFFNNTNDIKQKKYTVSINSQDRNLEKFPNPNQFEFMFNTNNTQFSNIIEIKLDNIILPKFSEVEGDLDNYPYLLLEIKELGSNYNGSNEFLNNAFAKLILDNTFGKYKSIKNCKITKQFSPPFNLTKLTIVIRKPNGELYDFGNNVIDLENDKIESKYNDPTVKNIVLYGGTKKQKNIIKPEINLDLQITYLVKEIGTHYTI